MIQVDLNLTLYGVKMDEHKPDMIKMVALTVFVSSAVYFVVSLWPPHLWLTLISLLRRCQVKFACILLCSYNNASSSFQGQICQSSYLVSEPVCYLSLKKYMHQPGIT